MILEEETLNVSAKKYAHNKRNNAIILLLSQYCIVLKVKRSVKWKNRALPGHKNEDSGNPGITRRITQW